MRKGEETERECVKERMCERAHARRCCAAPRSTAGRGGVGRHAPQCGGRGVGGSVGGGWFCLQDTAQLSFSD